MIVFAMYFAAGWKAGEQSKVEEMALLKDENYVLRLRLEGCMQGRDQRDEMLSLYKRALAERWLPGDRTALFKMVLHHSDRIGGLNDIYRGAALATWQPHREARHQVGDQAIR